MSRAELRPRSDCITTLDEVVLYGVIAFALGMALLAAGAGAGSLEVGLAGVSLVVAGTMVSWRTREWGGRGVLIGLPLGLAACAAFVLLVERQLAFEESPLSIAQSEVGLMLALRMSLLPIVFSFVLVKYEVIAFSLVPALTIFGLVGGQANEVLVGTCFALFLPAGLVAIGHGMLLSGLGRIGGRGDPRWRMGAWRRRHWAALGSSIGLIAALTCGLYLPISFYFAKYRWQILTRVGATSVPGNPMPWMLRAGGDQDFTVLPVGRGPLSPGEGLRFTIWGEQSPLWRGEVFDRYTGQAWLRAATPAEADPDSPPPPPPPRLVTEGSRFTLDLSGSFPPQPGAHLQTHLVRAEADTPRIFYSPGQIQRLTAPGVRLAPGQMDQNGCVEGRGRRWHRGNSYLVVSAPLEVRGPGQPGQQAAAPPPLSYLRVPFSARRVADLAREVAGDEPTAERRLAALVAYVQQHCVYTLEAPATPAKHDAADWFLFDSKRGYCDLFGTALALMGRAVGIPTRLVTGYAYGGPAAGAEPGSPPADLVATGGAGAGSATCYQFRESDAHVWVEAYLQPWGWVSADATPVGGGSPVPPLRRALLQLRFVWQDYPLAVFVVGVAVLGLLILLALRPESLRLQLPVRAGAPGDTRAAVMRSYAQLLGLLRQRGQPRRPAQTPLEFLAALQQACQAEPDASAPGPVWQAARQRSRRRQMRTQLGLQAALPAISSLTELFLLARYSLLAVSDEWAGLAQQHFAGARQELRRRRSARQPGPQITQIAQK